ncbi:MAG TPA: EpsG family protein [Edaphocola sp.]|nr:EpsG family protein [Edaphocola sp.]
MFDWVPLPYYSAIYYQVLLIITLIVFIHSQSFDLTDGKSLNMLKTIGSFCFIFVLFYIGTRPVSGRYFGDMFIYNKWFLHSASGGAESLSGSHDVFFNQFINFSARIMGNRSFFFVCAALYVIPAYLVSKKLFKKYWFYAFLMLVGSFSFFSYGTNGIRNGIATSFFLLGISQNKNIFKALWFLLAYGFHGSLIIPIIAYLATIFYNKTDTYFKVWLLCIVLSLALGSTFETLFSQFISDDRATYLTDTTAFQDQFSKTGFRWDFLLYSAAGVFSGWYYIKKKKIDDKLYNQLFNIYLTCNGFWILVIRASFSNRFAYLSWFLLAIIIIYPWLKFSFQKEQHKKIGYILLSYYGFTYFMNVVIYG